MRAKTSTARVSRWVFLLALLGAGGMACGSDAPARKSEPLTMLKPGEVSLPLRITPVLVEAPPRRVDLLPGRAEDKSAAGIKPDARGAGVPLAGLPVDLHEYPLLDFSAAGQEPGLNWIELALDTRGKGAVDALVRVGDPALFPDMVKEFIDFRSAEFAARDSSYKIKRALGIGGDGKWRYTAINASAGGIANGRVSASFEPGGTLTLQRAFASTDLAKTPWLRYEYELPRGSLWVVHINAKVDAGGLSPKLTTLLSRQVGGGGKQALLVNLYDLLQKADPGARDGRLEELFIHFSLDETAKAAVLNADIDLGRLEFYQAQISSQGSGAPIFLIAAEGAFSKINLLEMLEKRLSPTANRLTVLSGRLVSARQKSSDITEAFPKISLRAPYREKIPELFAGEALFLDELSGPELSAMLDRRMFVEKQTLWESGQSDVMFLSSGESTLPLASYAPNTRVEGDAYIKADYSCVGEGQLPLYLTLSGIGQHGRQVESDYLLSKNRPIKVRDLQIKQITLSFRQAGGSAVPVPVSCVVKNIQISALKKTAAYRPRPAAVHVALDGGVIPAGKLVWRADPGRFNVVLSDDDIRTVQTFSVETKLAGDAVIKYDLDLRASENAVALLRVRGDAGGIEKLIPLGRRGVVQVPHMVLHGLDIVVKGDASAPVTVFLNDLEVRYRGEGAHDQNDPKRPPRQPGKITYLAPHMALHEPALAWLKDYYADELARPDLTRMSKLDATLTYAQILDGGKIVVLPQAFLGKGGHELQSVAGDGVSVAIDQSFLLAKRDLLKAGPVKEAAGKTAPSNLAKMGLLLIIAGGLVLLLGIRFMPERASLVDRALSWELTFWSIQFGLLTAAFYMMFTSGAKDAFSLGGLLLAFAYGLAVRYRIRPYLAQKWVLFGARHSAPYFLLFLALLASSAVMLMLKRGAAAEHIAAVGYYLLVFGVAVEFICFAKESKMAPGSNEKSLSRP